MKNKNLVFFSGMYLFGGNSHKSGSSARHGRSRFTKKKVLTIAFFLLSFALFNFNLFAEEEWYWLNPLPHGHTVYSAYFIDANTGYAVGRFGTIIKTIDAGENWTEIFAPGIYKNLASVYFTDANTGYAVGGYGAILKTTDAGENWTKLSKVTTNHLRSVYLTDANTGYAVGDGGTILTNMSDLPYPVELYSFTATRDENRQYVNVKWTTVSGTNNSHFNVHRAYDDGRFEKIATIQGAGNSNRPIDYIYTDKPDNTSDVIYYKLSQHDFDGKSETFSPVAVTCIMKTDQAEKLNIFPNPAKDIINIIALSPIRTGATIKIYNINGVNVFEKELELNEGMNKTKVDVSGFTVGAYVVQVKSADVAFRQYIIHVKR